MSWSSFDNIKWQSLTSVVRCLHLSVPANIFRGAATPLLVRFCGHWSISTRLKSTSIPDVPLNWWSELILVRIGHLICKTSSSMIILCWFARREPLPGTFWIWQSLPLYRCSKQSELRSMCYLCVISQYCVQCTCSISASIQMPLIQISRDLLALQRIYHMLSISSPIPHTLGEWTMMTSSLIDIQRAPHVAKVS